MSNEENGKPAAPPQADLNLILGRALLGHAYAGSAFGVNTQTGENVGFNIASEAQKEEARQETEENVSAVGVKFASLTNQMTKMAATMQEQAEEVAYLRAQLIERNKTGKKKGKK